MGSKPFSTSCYAAFFMGEYQMPVNKSGVGTSTITEIKQEHFRMIIRTHLRIVKAIFAKNHYKIPVFHYFDINSGSGKNDGHSGSPLIFLEEAVRINIHYSAVFIDKDKNNIDSLLKLTRSYLNVKTYCGDHEEILPQLYPSDKSWRYGLLYTDPNGIFNAEILQNISKQPCFSALDVLINCPASAIKRMKNSSKCNDNRTLEDRLGIIQKKHWIIRNSLKNSTWQWTFLLGTNWTNFPEFTKIEMVKLNSPRGQAFFEKLNLTSKEREARHQPGLFDPKFKTYEEYLDSNEFAIVRKQVFQRANGICEKCHKKQVKDPHHLNYPKWFDGEIDIPENLIALCHECHCDIHGKEN